MVYVADVAPPIGDQLTLSVDISHCHVVDGAGTPVADAAVAVNVSPISTVPAIVGSPVMTGIIPAICPDDMLSAVSLPAAFVSVCTTRRYLS